MTRALWFVALVLFLIFFVLCIQDMAMSPDAVGP